MSTKTKTLCHALFFMFLALTGNVNSAKLKVPKSREGPGDSSALNMFNAMAELMTGIPDIEYDPDFIVKLNTCWDDLSENMWAAQDGAWGGMVQYHDQDGVPGDEWGSCLGIENGGHCVEYMEQNATQQTYHNVTIYEPCGYSSNMAYYHVSTEICEHMSHNGWTMSTESVTALGEIMSSLAMGSAFWHGSHTRNGNVADNRLIGVLAYILYQEGVLNLDPDTPVLKDLSVEGFRPFTGVELSNQITDMYLNTDVAEWEAFIMAIDMPNYYRTFAGIVVSLLTYTVDDETANMVIDTLAELFRFPQEEYDFLYDSLLPELRAAAANVNIAPDAKLQLQKNFVSSVIKLIYAFIVQEWAISTNEIIFTPEFNEAWTHYQPIVNTFANTLNDFTFYELNLQRGKDIYPGEDWCNPIYPHAKWHLQAAPGLLDLIYMTDDMQRLAVPEPQATTPSGAGFAQ